MAGKIIIDIERCKGCGLCVTVCPNNSIVISKVSNQKGYFPAVAKGSGCSGCAMCAIICPEAAIEVYRDRPKEIAAVSPDGKHKPSLVEEQR